MEDTMINTNREITLVDSYEEKARIQLREELENLKIDQIKRILTEINILNDIKLKIVKAESSSEVLNIIKNVNLRY